MRLFQMLLYSKKILLYCSNFFKDWSVCKCSDTPRTEVKFMSSEQTCLIQECGFSSWVRLVGTEARQGCPLSSMGAQGLLEFLCKKSPISERSMFSGSAVGFCCPSVSNYSCGLVTFIKILKCMSRYYKLLSYSY